MGSICIGASINSTSTFFCVVEKNRGLLPNYQNKERNYEG
jgi:hypothetical protein